MVIVIEPYGCFAGQPAPSRTFRRVNTGTLNDGFWPAGGVGWLTTNGRNPCESGRWRTDGRLRVGDRPFAAGLRRPGFDP